jgi:hypothetical protein
MIAPFFSKRRFFNHFSAKTPIKNSNKRPRETTKQNGKKKTRLKRSDVSKCMLLYLSVSLPTCLKTKMHNAPQRHTKKKNHKVGTE